MARRTRQEPEPNWFLADQAIAEPLLDRLSHGDVAATVVDAIKAAVPPATIGLLGGFGKGKSSTANLAKSMLGNSPDYDAVRVSAEKHAGAERARNLVHAVAAEIEQLDGIKPTEIQELLRPLRQATQVVGPDPTDTPFARLGYRYDGKKLALNLWPLAAVLVGTIVGAVLLGARLRDLLPIVVAAPMVVWVVSMTVRGPDSPIGSLLVPAKLTDTTPRAEAADEIELVFGNLVDHHRSKRKKRLVVFVDDIDRLSKNDLLDALRSLRSLQSVPKGSEPVFVVACNEGIVREAIQGSEEHPANLPSNASGDASEHDRAALAFLDKLLTVRIPMPPTMPGDMRAFANEVVPVDHPLREVLGPSLDRILAILIHARVDDPRSVIRLINGFIAAYLLGNRREAAGRVCKGDITGHLDVLAQLTVLLDEFPEFHGGVTRNAVLLPAATKLALRNSDLAESETDALLTQGIAVFRPRPPEADAETTTPDAPSLAFRSEPLRRYLAQTARLVSYPSDIGPLVYFTDTEGGRLLGVERRSRLLASLRIGDPEDLKTELESVPDDLRDAAGAEIVATLVAARPVDTPNLLAAVGPNLVQLGDRAGDAAAAAADLLARSPEASPDPEVVRALLDYADRGYDDELCRRFIGPEQVPERENHRMAVVAAYAASHQRLRPQLEPAVRSWLAELPVRGGWELATGWLDAGEQLDPVAYADLGRDLVHALVGLLRSDSGFSQEDSERLVALARVFPSEGAAPAQPAANVLLASRPGAVLLSTLAVLYDLSGYAGGPGASLLVGRCAADAEVALDVRVLAESLVRRWTPIWATATYVKKDDEEAKPIAPDVVALLAAACGEDGVLLDLLRNAIDLQPVATEDGLDQIFVIARERYTALLASGDFASAAEVGRSIGPVLDLVTAGASAPHVAALLLPLSSEGDPTSAAVRTALDLVTSLTSSQNGSAGLAVAAQQWSALLRTAGVHDHRTQVAAFEAIDLSLPQVVEEQALPILQQLDALIVGGDDVAGRLLILATFPWPSDRVLGALTTLDERWDDIPPDARSRALELAVGAADIEEAVWGRMSDRLIAAVEQDPAGAPARIAAVTLDRLSQAQRTRAFVAATGVHADMTAGFRGVSRDEAAATVVASGAGPSADRLLTTLEGSDREAVAALALSTLAVTVNADSNLIDTVAAVCNRAGLDGAVAVALDSLPGGNTTDVSALRVLGSAKTGGANLDLDRLGAVVPDMLTDASGEVRRRLGEVLNGHRLPKDVESRIKELREAGSTEEFDAARSGRS